ncbi:ladderlectin-like [Saccoglossus kowalevskii]|uniref:Uncharacterized protein LOC102808774 n=1 Tax=Saccoglossus kowalevskii TaxID=10224 RepID=A0ABM0MT03_SACKO|nr:PREDICTED: uncharacterized protein LOC102808774 [Saccoglossus kowalevskii]
MAKYVIGLATLTVIGSGAAIGGGLLLGTKSSGPTVECSRYFIIQEILPFLEAQARCAEFNGTLGSINSDEAYSAVDAFFGEVRPHVNAWVGAKRISGEYFWLDGSEFNHAKWANNQPNNQDCVYKGWSTNHRYYTGGCGMTHPASLCEENGKF